MNYEKRARVLKALAHPARLRILRELCVERTNVTALCERVGLPQPTVSRHLAVLRNAGIIDGERHGLEVDYHFECEKMSGFIRAILQDEESDLSPPPRKDDAP